MSFQHGRWHHHLMADSPDLIRKALALLRQAYGLPDGDDYRIICTPGMTKLVRAHGRELDRSGQQEQAAEQP